MEFLTLEKEAQLEEIIAEKNMQIIYKHNITCAISKAVLRNMKEEADLLPTGTPFYVLNLLDHRDMSNAIAKKFSVIHESPQLLLIKEGKCMYNKSLNNITAKGTAEAIAEFARQ